MKQKKIIFVVLFLFVLSVSIAGFIFWRQPDQLQSNNETTNAVTAPTQPDSRDRFLIDGYPIDTVPLYKLSKVSSNKIFVNTDPKNLSEFDENNFAYFNVVFET